MQIYMEHHETVLWIKSFVASPTIEQVLFILVNYNTSALYPFQL